MPLAEGALSHPGLLGRVLDWVRTQTDPASDLTTLSRDELRRIADDLSLTELDLLSLSVRAHDHSALMERMIRAHGIDPEQMRHGFAVLLRDMERVCSHCRLTGRCGRELDAGTATKNCHEYCPNAATFDELVGGEGVPRFP
jgi:hypothetical protein